jgi:hypothetical protein
LIDFGRVVSVDTISINFQGGFVGTELQVKAASFEDLIHIITFFPKDHNDTQIFSLESPATCQVLHLNFPSSTDFYGRITIYDLQVERRNSFNS